MKKYQFSSEISQTIVNGILQGYKNYIQERELKKEEMRISSAYAWVKGNHIDDQTAEECETHGISYSKAKAGYTWGYLQFNLESERKMFIIKNAKYFDTDNFPNTRHVTGKKGSKGEESYLKKLSRINRHVDFPSNMTFDFDSAREQNYVIFDDQTMKDLEEPQVQNLEENCDQFYILTYEIDEANMISALRLLMPNPSDNIAYEVEDLSGYIGTSTVNFDDVNPEILTDQEEEFVGSTPAYEYGIYHESELEDESEGTED
ncbi:spr1630 family ClpXP-sensitive toxin [Halobacillus salinus]|uniref:spr1630 family ClpXP-sensitive toxin n=1 Tax=Halobacillus salinus TaxID=192814 RepID=UPI0009A56BCC|nr:hypothetical protein [Halobacillus salinus]